MSKIVILGSSIAATKLIEALREKDKTNEITLLAFEGCYPYCRNLFPEFLSKDIKADEVFYKHTDFYKENNVNVILDKKVTRINLKRKKIHSEDKSQIDFDILIMTDIPGLRFPDIKGVNKDGVSGYKKLNSINEIADRLPFIETVVIQSDNLFGLRIARSLVALEKDVSLIWSGNNIFSQALDCEVVDWIIEFFREKGLQIFDNNSIIEVLGDSEVKAIRLKSSKVLASQIVLFDEAKEDYRYVSEFVEVREKVCVDEKFETDIENVFACDSVSQLRNEQQFLTPIKDEEELGQEAQVISNTIFEKQESVSSQVPVVLSNMEGLSLAFLGDVRRNEGRNVRSNFDRENGKYISLVISEDNILIGAVLVNRIKELDKLLRLIEEKVNLVNVDDILRGDGVSGGEQTQEVSSVEHLETIEKTE